MKSLTELIYNNYYQKTKTLTLTKEDQKDFESSDVCHICEQEFDEDYDTAKMLEVRDHCHFTGDYRGSAHNQCNLQSSVSKTFNSSGIITQSSRV